MPIPSVTAIGPAVAPVSNRCDRPGAMAKQKGGMAKRSAAMTSVPQAIGNQTHRASLPLSPIRNPKSEIQKSAFTLVELLVSVAIIGTLLAIGSFAFRNVREAGALALSKNAVVTFAHIARNYAVANQIETMLVVNPYNGRFEIWHLNPPQQGGPWDPASGGTFGNDPRMTDGYAFAPILDHSAALPLDGNGKPLVAVHPIDYDDPLYRPLMPANEPNTDNLIWAAFCFDENGRLVTRTRRIATRSYHFRNGALRPVSTRNRLLDESPDLALRAVGALVDATDTPITSTRGFVISERLRMDAVLGTAPTPTQMVDNWLRQTRPGAQYAGFAETVLLDRFTGRELMGDQ
ncbi:MAG: Tfp pilus assembly protein FimT/FimU [Phycisphaerae bacterium]